MNTLTRKITTKYRIHLDSGTYKSKPEVAQGGCLGCAGIHDTTLCRQLRGANGYRSKADEIDCLREHIIFVAKDKH